MEPMRRAEVVVKSEINGRDAKVYAALEALSRATTWDEYNDAKRLAGRCDRISQEAMVDSLKDARERVIRLERNANATTTGGNNAR
jgi:hypothetical protein